MVHMSAIQENIRDMENAKLNYKTFRSDCYRTHLGNIGPRKTIALAVIHIFKRTDNIKGVPGTVMYQWVLQHLDA
ncbi:hypothetical protein SK128_008087 [Halocaridina rubra]|uniref:Uncharacterized protein n=1 Tax=Halocaridina rubra TaxID=373956 RepID=A0AAN8WKL8_HALRR